MIAERERIQRQATTVTQPRPTRTTVERVRERSVQGTVKNRTQAQSGNAFGKREMLAVVTTFFVATLLCLYLMAYARVTADSYAVNRLEKRLRLAEAEGRALEAKISQYHLPDVIRKRAEAVGMVPADANHIQILNQAQNLYPKTADSVARKTQQTQEAQ